LLLAKADNCGSGGLRRRILLLALAAERNRLGRASNPHLEARVPMTSATRMLLVICVLASACGSSTEPKAYDLTGFWSGTTTYSTDPSCELLSCDFDSRMMIVQTGASVEGWYRARAGLPGDQTTFVGSVHGDTLSVLISSGQVVLVGPVKFRILPGGENLVATNNGKTFRFAVEK
jgi:hypothetical protein